MSWLHMAFFASWGYWNLVYYATLAQWVSWFGGMFLVATNTVYLAQMLYYSRYPGGKDARVTRRGLQ